MLEFSALAGSSTSYTRLIADTLGLELERAGYTLIPNARITAALGSASGQAAAMEAARRVSADVLVLGFYVIEGDEIRIGVRAIDVASQATALSVESAGLAGFDVFDTIDELSANIALRIQRAIKPVPEAEQVVEREEIIIETTVVEEVVELGESIELTLQSRDEGALVSAIGGEGGFIELGTVSERTLMLPAKEGALLALSIEKEGYYPRQLRFTATKAKPVIRVPALARRPSPEWYLRSSLDRPFGLEAGARWYFLSSFVAPEAGLGLHYLPYRYPEFLSFGIEPYIDSGGGAMNLSLALGSSFFPLRLVVPGSLLQPYLYAGMEAAAGAAFGSAAPAYSLLVRGIPGAGVQLALRFGSVTLDARVLTPSFLSLGAMPTSDRSMSLRLSAEVAIPW